MILEWRVAHEDGVPEVISGWPYDRVCKDAEGCVLVSCIPEVIARLFYDGDSGDGRIRLFLACTA